MDKFIRVDPELTILLASHKIVHILANGMMHVHTGDFGRCEYIKQRRCGKPADVWSEASKPRGKYCKKHWNLLVRMLSVMKKAAL